MKLWDKGIPTNKAIEDFTVGKDRELDLYLAQYDILGSMAHVTMLESVGLIEKEELPILLKELKKRQGEGEKLGIKEPTPEEFEIIREKVGND